MIRFSLLLAASCALIGCAPMPVAPPASPVAAVPAGTAGQPSTQAPPPGEPGANAPGESGGPSPQAPGAAPGGSGGGGVAADRPQLALTVSAQAPGTWSAAAPLRLPRLGAPAAAIGGQLVVAEGAPVPSHEIFDGAAWTLAPLAPDVSSGKYMSAGVLAGAELLVVGGEYGYYSSLISGFDGQGRTAFRRQMVDPATLESLGRQAPAVAVFDRTLVVAGGQTEGEAIAPSTLLVDLDAESPSATEADLLAAQPAAAMPHPVAGAAMAALDDRLYVLGGYALEAGEAVATAAAQAYDLSDDAWSLEAAPALPAARHGGAAAVLGGRIYFAGGLNELGRPAAEVWRWAPGEPEWTLETQLPTPRAYLALVAWEGRLWAIGGASASGPSTTVEVYRP